MSRSACSKHIFATVLEIMLRHLEQKQLMTAHFPLLCVFSCGPALGTEQTGQSGLWLTDWHTDKIEILWTICFSFMWKKKLFQNQILHL